ncbi:MAG: hypothetical protein KA270_17415, partial [Saprospiraceae bacterium]|nr:hypothetical protein [Saprospiraceae bacterium]
MKVIFPSTPENIQDLLPKQIFVFGSNEAGTHGAGAAKLALDKFGATNSKGIGLQGNSYALPTKDKMIKTLPLSKIQTYVDTLWQFAKDTPMLQFLITKVGCGLAGYTEKDIAPLFFKFVVLDNVTLPQEFIDIIAPKAIYTGYKAMNKKEEKLFCRDYEFNIGKTYTALGEIKSCNNGFHFCEKIIDTLNYYNRNDVVYCEVIGWGNVDIESDKIAVEHIFIKNLYLHNDKDFNSGNGNSGNRNSGNWNSGDWNSGNGNSGNWNSGNWNSGNRNSGNRNSGNGNSGNRNSGNRNPGNGNTGDRNS